jgi:serine/threonine-protein kinase
MGFKARQKVGKYRILSRLAEGGFAAVYVATDTVEGVRVAIKVPHDRLVTKNVLADFRKEARLVSSLDHPHILPIKTAEEIEGRFAIVTRLGTETLATRLSRRLSRETVLDFSQQLLEALAFAHKRKIIHCDLKPENLILFPDKVLRLADFGIAKVALKTLHSASGSGTVGYMAPEQAMGRPSIRSDVFSAGLIIYRMAAGQLPQWPFQWPLEGAERLERNWHPRFLSFLRRALQMNDKKRFASAVTMLRDFRKIRPDAILQARSASRRKTSTRRK